jgi:hypothetical protein
MPVYLTPKTGTPLTTIMPNVQSHTLSAWSGPDSCGGWTKLNVTEGTQGTFTISAVPQAPYYLFFDAEVYHIASRKPEIGPWFLGRNPVTLAMSTTTVTLQATGLSPWAMGDEIEISSFSANAFERGLGFALPANATMLNGKVDWSTQTGNPHALLVSTDTLTYIQLVTHTTGAVTYKAAEASGSVTGITMTDGTPVALPSATIAPLALTSHPVTWNIPAYEAYQMAVHPMAAVVGNNGHGYHLSVLGAPPMYGATGWNPDLITVVQPAGVPAVSLSVSVGNPFPGYGTFCDVGTQWTVNYTLPSTSAVPITYPMVSHDPTCAANTAPAMSPAQNVQIDGAAWALSTTMATTLKSDTPKVSWTAPKVGTPARYDLVVIQLAIKTGATVIAAINGLHTMGTSVVVPPTMLKSGANYVFVLQASSNCTMCDSDPTRYSLPAAFAPTFSGLYKAP